MNPAKVKIIGNLYMKKDNLGKNSSKVTGEIMDKEKFTEINYNQFEKYAEELKSKDAKAFKINSNVVLEGDYEVDNLHIKNNEVIEIGENNVLLSIRDFKQTGQGVFKVNGRGTLTIFVSGDFKINGGEFNPSEANVRIVSKSNKSKIDIDAHRKVYAQVIAPKSAVSIGSILYGTVIANEVKLYGGQGQVKYHNFNFDDSESGADITSEPAIESN